MGSKVQRIRNLGTVKALRGQSLTIDLGETLVGVVTAWMKKDPNSTSYREFTVVSNRYLLLPKDNTEDYYDVGTGLLIERVQGKWYFDVRVVPIASVDTDEEEVVTNGVIFFKDNVTDSLGAPLVYTNVPGLNAFTSLIDSPAAYLPADVGKTLQVNSTFTGVEFKSITEDLSYIHTQTASASVWSITHSLGKYPSVSVVDSGSNLVFGDIQYIDLNNLTITFTAAFSGSAFIN
jgi:hypothetical protein